MNDSGLFPRLTRRTLLTAGGGGLVLALPLARALGHDDDDDHYDDDHHDDHHDEEGDVAAQGTVPAGSAEVRIVDDDASGFRPGTTTVELGQQVTFVNLDDEAHTATGAGFDTGIMQPGELVSVTFDEPGSFPYSCEIHPVMTGVIEVRDAEGATASPEATPDAATPAAGDATEVTIRDFAYEPAEIEIASGTTVTWTNEDGVPHTATDADGAFDTGTIDGDGGTGRHTFDTPGSFRYICAFHPNMEGLVVVV
jgi:plastocyanin